MDPEGKDGFPPASEAAGDDISMEAFREWFSKYGGAAAMRLLDIDAKYQLWLVGACPLVAGRGNVAQLSADTGLSAGYRMVSSFALVEKARQLCETKRWPTGKSLRVWTQQTSKASGAVGQRGAADAKPGAAEAKFAYVSGHHRGCALHALFLFHHCAGQAPPEWLVRMGQQVPAHVESGMTAEAAAIQGMAATAQAQHGTTPTTYLDLVRVVGAGGACRGLSAEQVRNKLKQEIPAFVERMAPEGWMRLGWVATRVCSRALDRLYDFADKWGSVPIPMKWWRESWMLLPSQDRSGRGAGESIDELAQTLLVRRLLMQVAELIEELLQQQQLERHEVTSKLPGILTKARFSMERRRALRDLCVKFSSGMGAAVTKHRLDATVVQEMHKEFCQGAADEELEALTVPPDLFWPRSKFVSRKKQEAETRESEILRSSLQKNLEEARGAVHAESVGHHAEWKAACELYSHLLEVDGNAIVDEGLEMIKEMEKKRSEKSVSAIS